jgi:superkiller protein 3
MDKMPRTPIKTLLPALFAAALVLGCATTSEARKPKPEELYQQAVEADRADNTDQAIGLLRQAITAKPKLKEAHFLLARIYTDRGMYDEAVGGLKVAAQLKHPEAPRQLARVYHRAGMLDDAQVMFTELLRKSPNDPDLRYRLGKVLLDKGDLNAAGESFRQVLQMDPNNAAAHNGLASLYYRQRMTGDAMAEFQKALQLDPNLSDAYLDLGNLHFETGKYQEAARLFKRYTELEPREVAGHFLLAKAYQMQKDTALFREGVAAAERAVRIDPNNDGAWYMLATFYRDGKQYQKSVEAFQRALKLSPVDPDRWFEAGQIYVKAAAAMQDAKDTVRAREYLDEAIVCYEKRCEMDPAKVEDTYYAMGTAYYLSADYDKAIEWYQKRIGVNPRNAFGVYMNLGYSYSLKGQKLKQAGAEAKALYLQAIEAFTEARKLSPERIQPLEAIAQHYVFVGQKFNDRSFIAKAKAMIAEIRKRDPGNKTARDLEQAMKPKIEVW